MTALRLALVTETYPPEINGVARTLGNWVHAFQNRGHNVQVLRPRQPNERATRERIHGFPLPMYPKLRFGVASPLRLRRLLKGHRPNLIHIATEGPLGLSALAAARLLGIPVASSFHTNFDQYFTHYGMSPLRGLVWRYLRWFHNRTDVTLVPSESTKARLEELGIERVAIWSRGVDAQVFHPRFRDAKLRASLGLSENDLMLLYVGRLAAEKNIPVMLDAFSRLCKRLPRTVAERLQLVLVGDGPMREELVSNPKPQVVLPGEKRGEELSRWYASGDLFLFPSQSETFGNCMLEAQASGLPVVGFDSQAVNERITDGVDGLLVPPEGDFSAAIEELVLAPETRQHYAHAARAKAERQSWGTIFDGLERRYLRLVGEDLA